MSAMDTRENTRASVKGKAGEATREKKVLEEILETKTGSDKREVNIQRRFDGKEE